MRTRALTALAVTGAALTLAVPAAHATADTTAATPTCRDSQLRTAASGDGSGILKISVTNRSARPCIVDHVPSIVFGDLDGPAQPVPPTGNAPYRLSAGTTAHAAVRTVADLDDPEARVVEYVTVAADSSRLGTRFEAAALGSPEGVVVWEPVTTRWKATAAEAAAELAASTRD